MVCRLTNVHVCPQYLFQSAAVNCMLLVRRRADSGQRPMAAAGFEWGHEQHGRRRHVFFIFSLLTPCNMCVNGRPRNQYHGRAKKHGWHVHDPFCFFFSNF